MQDGVQKVDGILEKHFKPFGWRRLLTVGPSILKMQRALHNTDHAWWEAYSMLTHEFSPRESDEARDWTIEEKEKRRAAYWRLVEHFRESARCLPIVVDIAEACIEFPPDPYPTFVRGPEHRQALESMIWRCYDALKSVSLLQPEGLLSDAQMSLRSAQEALLLFNHFLKGVDRVRRFRRRCLAEEAATLEWTMQRTDLPCSGEEFAIVGRYLEVIGEMRQLKTWRCSEVATRSLMWTGTKPARNPEWKKLVQNDIFRQVYGENEQFRGCQQTYIDGNSAAHSSYQNWAVEREGRETLVVKASVEGRPVRLRVNALLLFRDYVECLKMLRPQLVAPYEFFFNSMAGHWLRYADEQDWGIVPALLEEAPETRDKTP